MRFRFILFLIAILAFTVDAQAQFGNTIPEQVVSWSAAARPPSSAPEMTNTFGTGDRVYVTLNANIVSGWRVYSLDSPAGRPLAIELDQLPQGLGRYGSLGETATKDGYDVGLDANYTYHDGRARVWQGLVVQEGARAGERVVSGRIRYAACNDEMCLPTQTVPFSVTFSVSR